jgi:phosphate starvation-inducible PhoH-like protein
MYQKRRGNNRKQNNRIIDEELTRYNETKEYTKTTFENFQYLSNKERNTIENKFSKPKNASQARYIHALNKPHNKIIIATGPAGTGKTLFGTEYGLRHFLMGKFEKIIFTRPAVSADEDLGYLPGTLEEKMAPWVRPIYDILYRFISPAEVTSMLEDKQIEIAPLAYMRGRTFKNTWIIADEIQNSSISQMKMLLTRLGENSRMVITGDLDQNDRKGEVNGLQDFLEKFRGCRSTSITSIEFDTQDIEREEVIKEILDIYAGVVPEYYVADRESESDSENSNMSGGNKNE